MNEFSGFPRNLAYSVKKLSAFSKTCVKCTPDKWNNVNAGETIRVKLPPNSLIDLRTLTMYFDGTISSTAGKAHFPRLSSSLIEQMSIYVNGTMIENIQQYGLLYNTLFDLDCGGIDQFSKRSVLENYDPSVSYTADDVGGSATCLFNTSLATPNDTKKPMMINQWLGFIGSASTPVIDTNDCSDIYLEVRFANPTVLFSAGATEAQGVSYKLDDIRFTISKIVFNSPDYYNMKASKLLGEGLVVGYQTYITNKGSSQSKTSSLSYTVNINSTSLDQVIGTFLDKDYNSIKPLILSGANADASTAAFAKALAEPKNDDKLFNQSVAFQRNATGLKCSSYEINNVMMNAYPLPASEIFNETLIALGNNNIDMASGIAAGCVSLDAHFVKYYFAHILSLENLSNDGQFFKSGLDGRAASMTINWKSSFADGQTDTCTPVLFCKTTRLLQINEAHQISVVV